MRENERQAIEKHREQLCACLLPKMNDTLTYLRLNECIPPKTELDIQKMPPAEQPLPLLDFIMHVDSVWEVLNSFLCSNGHEDLSKNLRTTAENIPLTKPQETLCSISAHPQAHAVLSKPWNAPLRQCKFLGRKSFQQQLDTLQNAGFELCERSSHSVKTLAVCVGLGGVGKSSIVLEFIYRNMERYKYVFWIPATTPERIEACYAKLGAQLALPVSGSKPHRWSETPLWLSINPGWLIVFDDAPCYSMVQSYIPRTGGNVLITSRCTDWPYFIITITPFIQEETTKYVELVFETESVAKEVSVFAHTIGNLPLAVAQATAYMLKHKIGVDEYLTRLKIAEREHRISDIFPSVYDSESVCYIWDVSVQKAKRECSFCVDLLNFSSLLDDSYIPDMLVCEFAKQRNCSFVLDIAKNALLRYSLISMTSNDKQGITMHPLVQLVTKSKLTSTTLSNYIKDLCKCIDNVWPSDPERNHDIVLDIYPTIEKCMQYILEKEVTEGSNAQLTVNVQLQTLFIAGLANEILGNYTQWHTYFRRMNLSVKASDLCNTDKPLFVKFRKNLANTYKHIGNYKKQQRILHRVLEMEEELYGPDHIEVAVTLLSLGNAYGDDGNYLKQQELSERAHNINLKSYRPDHKEVAVALVSLGHAYGGLRNYLKQKELLKQGLLIMEKEYGSHHRTVAVIINNLGKAYGNLGDYQKQKELLERALLINEKHYGSDHKEVAITLGNLAMAYDVLGDYQKSKELLERALLINENHYDVDYKKVAVTLTSLGHAYGGLGDYQKQKEVLERALQIVEKHCCSDYREVAVILTNLGNAYGNLRDHHKQKEVLERALQIVEEHCGSDYREVAVTLTNLGNAYGGLGDYQKQAEVLKRALLMIDEDRGSDYTEVATTLTNLGNSYGSLGNYQMQKEILERALRIIEEYCRCDHRVIGIALVGLGKAYGGLGDCDKAQELLKRALEINTNHYGSNHKEVALTLSSLGATYGYKADYQNQKELLTQALLIDESFYGPDHKEVAVALLDLANAYADLGYYQKQSELLNRALSINENNYGLDHKEVATALLNLGNAYANLGYYQYQRELVERALIINENYYGPEHKNVAQTLRNLGIAYGGLADYQKQVQLLERAQFIIETHYPADHREIALTLSNLGNAYGRLGDYQKQKELLERALLTMKNYHGPDYKETIVILTSLGNVYGSLGDYQKQKELLEQALPVIENHYNPDYKELAITLTDLGKTYGSLGIYKKQEELLERVLLIKEKYYGPDSKEVAVTLTDLGRTHCYLDDYQKHKELLERALLIIEKHYGPSHIEIAVILTSLGNAYGVTNEYQKQRELLERALPIIENRYGPDHNEVAVALTNLANAYGNLRDYKRQKELLERELSIIQNRCGPDSMNVAIKLTNLGNVYGSHGDYQRQQEHLERALLIIEKCYGPDHKAVAATLSSLGNAYGHLENHEKKRALLQRALLINEKVYGPEHKEIAVTLINLGNAYGCLGDYQNQKDALERALLIIEKLYGPDHNEVAVTLTDLGNAYGCLGDYQKQKEVLERALLVIERYYGAHDQEVAVILTNLVNAYGQLGDHQKETECSEKASLIQKKCNENNFLNVTGHRKSANYDRVCGDFKRRRIEEPFPAVVTEEGNESLNNQSSIQAADQLSTEPENVVQRSRQNVTSSSAANDLFWPISTVLIERKRKSHHVLRSSYDTGFLVLINHPSLHIELKGVITSNAFLNFNALQQRDECRLHVFVDPHDTNSLPQSATTLTDWFSHDGYTFTCAFQNCTFLQLSEPVVQQLNQKNYVFHDISQSLKCSTFMLEGDRRNCIVIQYDVSDETGVVSNIKSVDGIVTGVFGTKVNYRFQYDKATNMRIACPILQFDDRDRAIVVILHYAQYANKHNSLVQNELSTLFEGTLLKYVYAAICEDFNLCRLAEVRAPRTADTDEFRGMVQDRLLPDLRCYFQPKSASVQVARGNVIIEMEFNGNKVFILMTHYHMFCSFSRVSQRFGKEIWYPVCRDSRPWSADMRLTDWTLECPAQHAITYLSTFVRLYIASPAITINAAFNSIDTGYYHVSAGNIIPPSENILKKIRKTVRYCTCTVSAPDGRIATAVLVELKLTNPCFGLMTNQHVLTTDIIMSNEEFELEFKGLPSPLLFKLSMENRGNYIFCSRHLDCTFIEVTKTFVQTLSNENCVFVPINDATPVMYEEHSFIVVAHYPGGADFTITHGKVGSDPLSCGSKVQHNADTAKGSSGGPIFNTKACMIGIHCGGIVFEDSKHLVVNHFIRMDSILIAIKRDLSMSKNNNQAFPRALRQLDLHLENLFLNIFDKDHGDKMIKSRDDPNMFCFTTQATKELIWFARTPYGWFVSRSNNDIEFKYPQKISNWHYLDHAAQKTILDGVTSPVIEDVLQFLIKTESFYIIAQTLRNDDWS